MQKEILSKLKSALSQDKDILFGYIFGSTAGKGFNPKSDIDTAVYLDGKKVKDFFKKRLQLIGSLEKILKREIEVIALNEIESVFLKFVVIKEGKLILERNHQKRVEFEFKTLQDYFDFQPFVEEYNKIYLERELAKL